MDSLTPEAIAYGLTSYVVLLFSLSVHESAHAWAALRMGDDTAQRMGRISLNPIVHMDPIGTVLMPLLQFAMSGVPLLAWAKPTPYNPANFRRDVTLGTGHLVVAAAGPLSNVGLSLAFTLALFVAAQAGLVTRTLNPVVVLIANGVQLNVLLAIFNLIPVPPLDGSKVAAWGLPRAVADRYVALVQSAGPWLLFLLLIPISRVLTPIYSYLSILLIRSVVS